MLYTDKAILQRLQCDRETGAAMLMEEYAGLIWSVCEKYLDNEEDIRECVNSTFADFCLEPERFDAKKASLKTYLCVLARNKAIDCYQANIRRAKLRERAEDMLRAGSARDLMAERLEEALEQLEPLDSQILRMKYYGGHSYREIAEELGLNEAAVKMRSMRSRKKLLKILIGVLIFLLLAACAAIAIRHYHFSEYSGIIWSDESWLYELDDGEYVCELDGHRICVEEAVFAASGERAAEGSVTLYITVTPPEDIQSLNDYAGRAKDLDRFALFGDRPTSVPNDMKMKWDDARGCLQYEIEIALELPQADADSITMPLYMGEEHLMDITLVPARFREFEVEAKSMVFLEGLEWVPGPALTGQEQTIVNMTQYSAGTWSVSPQLTSSRYGRTPGERLPIVLVGEDGAEYEMRYGVLNGSASEGTASYDLAFPPVPAGTYTLEIPYLFLQSSQSTGTVTFELPEEEDQTMPCDVTASFPDGSQLHITGIGKTQYEQISYDLFEGSDELVENRVYYWEYALEMQTVSADGPSLCMAIPECVGDTAIYSGISADTGLVFRILQGEEPEEIVLRFVEPEYLLEEEFSLEVTVQPSEE